MESQDRFPLPLEIAARFPHSHRSDDDGSYQNQTKTSRDCKRFSDGETVDRLLSNLIGGWAFEADDLSQEKERTFHQGPRVTTLKLEAGYMHAVLLERQSRIFLQRCAGSIYALDNLLQS